MRLVSSSPFLRGNQEDNHRIPLLRLTAIILALSHWCIFHRQKAELVVHTWDKQFHIAQKEQKVPFLYLANDIIQNSRRKGNEFVAEFWKVLPAALKGVIEAGDDRAKSVVSRLVCCFNCVQ